MDLEAILKLKEQVESEQPVRETCPDCEGIPNEHDSSSGPWLWCPTCDHKGFLEHYPLRDMYRGILWDLGGSLLDLWKVSTCMPLKDIHEATEKLKEVAEPWKVNEF